MKTLFILLCSFVALGTISCIKVSAESNIEKSPRNLQYENYCDSIWNTDKEYYLDILSETDEYQLYIAEHGEWWNK